ncbi:MAG TPA: cation:proton antiporter [Galbitalea sp.]|nr:cation:proton antiporter [Galbitalea sp.]
MSFSFSTLVLVGAVALLGPLLALPTKLRIPVLIGELIGGILIGGSGFGLVKASDPLFSFLANIGFGLTMFVAGSHVPLRDARLRPALVMALVRALVIGVAAALLGMLLAVVFHSAHAAVFAVLMASSSAALVLPTVDSERLGGPKVLVMLAQVAIADTACIIALPLAIDPENAAPAALGALVIAVGALIFYLILRALDKRGQLVRFHDFSERRHFALELRVSLVVLFGLAAIATTTHVSIMLAGFACGLAIAGVGAPRRLAEQLFALNDGFLGPLFFVWLGSSLSLRALVGHPEWILLGVCLGVGAIAAHLVGLFFREPVSLGVMSAAQLGVPVAAATIGQQSHLLAAGEPAALILGALISIAGLAIASSVASRGKFNVSGASGLDPDIVQPPAPAQPSPPGA